MLGTLKKVKMLWEPSRPLVKTSKLKTSEIPSKELLNPWMLPIQLEVLDFRQESKQELKLFNKALRNNSTSWDLPFKFPILKCSKLQRHRNSSRKQHHHHRSTPLDGNEAQRKIPKV